MTFAESAEGSGGSPLSHTDQLRSPLSQATSGAWDDAHPGGYDAFFDGRYDRSADEMHALFRLGLREEIQEDVLSTYLPELDRGLVLQRGGPTLRYSWIIWIISRIGTAGSFGSIFTRQSVRVQ